MKNVYGYIRVSTIKQGSGVSLHEQKDAIIQYAAKHNLNIVEWFEELETAAKQGRPLFTKMMQLLKSKKVSGTIIHKIDRSARNLKDWAALGDLIDAGIEVHFAHESLDLDTRGGRLAADIQAVIASDYIRNLREEAIKGLQGRLKQGIYPFGAPTGYINNGRGQLKTMDPIAGPLVKKAFELYSNEKYNLKNLTKKMFELGLRNKNNKPITKTTLSQIFNNTFYMGVMTVKGKSFIGLHTPLISKALFLKVQLVLKGKTNTKVKNHDYLFRRMVKCEICDCSLTPESQKGYIYYRCHTKRCHSKTIREDKILEPILSILDSIRLNKIEYDTIQQLLKVIKLNWQVYNKNLLQSFKLQEQKVSQKLDRLTDAYIDNILTAEAYEVKKKQLIMDLQECKEKTKNIESQKEAIFIKAQKFFEHIKNLKNSFNSGIIDEKRKLLKTMISNLTFNVNKLCFTMKSPFGELTNRSLLLSGALDRDTVRTNTIEFAIPETQGTDRHTQHIEPVRRIDPHPPLNLPSPEVDAFRASMQQLLDIVLAFLEDDKRQVDEGLVSEEKSFLYDYVQEDDTDSQYRIRPIPENFKRKRA